jgi:lipopolysaccharide biosynthesis glycosyltransferase
MIMHVCLATDNNYVKYMAATMASVLCNTGNKVCFYILDGGISEENKAKLEELKKIKECTISILAVSEEIFAIYPIGKYWTQAVYYRYLIPSLIKADKVLYLDCDVIVAKNIDELWDTELDGFYLAGVEDIDKDVHAVRMGLVDYINAGILLINNKLWQADNVEQKLFEYTATNIQKIPYQDQDVINAVCEGKIKLLSEKWNYYRQKQLNKDACIHHYIGINKPWIARAKTLHKEVFWKYFVMTAWGREYTSGVKILHEFYRIRYKIKTFLKRAVGFDTKMR